MLRHDLDSFLALRNVPLTAMTEAERRAERRFDAYFAFETMTLDADD